MEDFLPYLDDASATATTSVQGDYSVERSDETLQNFRKEEKHIDINKIICEIRMEVSNKHNKKE